MKKGIRLADTENKHTVKWNPTRLKNIQWAIPNFQAYWKEKMNHKTSNKQDKKRTHAVAWESNEWTKQELSLDQLVLPAQDKNKTRLQGKSYGILQWFWSEYWYIVSFREKFIRRLWNSSRISIRILVWRCSCLFLDHNWSEFQSEADL